MVKKSTQSLNKDEWAAANPVEADILNLFEAAQNWAFSKVEFIETGDPKQPYERGSDDITDLEISVLRAIDAVKKMMSTREARKAAGLRPKGRGRDKSYDPKITSISDPQVEIIFRLIRKEIKRSEALVKIAEIISAGGNIDPRILNRYVDEMIEIWSWFASDNPSPFRIPIDNKK